MLDARCYHWKSPVRSSLELLSGTSTTCSTVLQLLLFACPVQSTHGHGHVVRIVTQHRECGILVLVLELVLVLDVAAAPRCRGRGEGGDSF